MRVEGLLSCGRRVYSAIRSFLIVMEQMMWFPPINSNLLMWWIAWLYYLTLHRPCVPLDGAAAAGMSEVPALINLQSHRGDKT